jgi:hypothetical protein
MENSCGSSVEQPIAPTTICEKGRSSMVYRFDAFELDF